jgi:hypothetical protein
MRPLRSASTVLALMLIAAACGASNDDGQEAPAASVDAPDAGEPAQEPDPTAGAEGAEATQGADPPSPAGDQFSPTETDAPFDLSGGAISSSEGVQIVDADPRAPLAANVSQATAPWVTDWTRQTIDVSQLILGVPRVDPRDAIPPLDLPKFEPIAEAGWLGERELGAVVRVDGETRFYPLSILSRHEIVNDRFGDVPVAVTFCPLCNTALAFDRRVDGQVIRLGVSGLLRNSDMVMWDNVTNSLWQQITGEGIVGELAGTRLELMSTSIASYGDVLESFPDALSLSLDTGFGINYGANGYVGYSSSVTPFLFDGVPDDRFPALSRVVGISAGGVDKAYPFSVLSEEPAINDELSGVPVAVLWGSDTADALDQANIATSATIGTAVAFDPVVDGQRLTFSSVDDDLFVDAETGSTWTVLGLSVDGPLAGRQLGTVTHRNEFWFAWAAFFPDAGVYPAS